MRRNFEPTPEEHRRIVRGKQLGIKNKTIPLDSDIKFCENMSNRINHGEVKVIPWSESSSGSVTFTLRFDKEQPMRRLLDELFDIFGKDYIEDKTKSIVVSLNKLKNKKDISEKLMKYFVVTI